MRGVCIVTLIGSLSFLPGCRHPTQPTSDKPARPTTFQIVIKANEEHLGHNIDESGGHGVWCDGIRL